MTMTQYSVTTDNTIQDNTTTGKRVIEESSVDWNGRTYLN